MGRLGGFRSGKGIIWVWKIHSHRAISLHEEHYSWALRAAKALQIQTDNVITRGTLYRHLREVAMVPDQHWAITQARGKGDLRDRQNPTLSTWYLSFSICGNTFHFIFRRNLFVKKRLLFTTIEAIEKYKKSFGGFTGPKTGTELRYLYSWGISCDSEEQNLSLCLSQVHFYAQKAELEDPRNPVLLSKPPLFWLLPNLRLFWLLLLLSASIARLRRSYKKCGEDLDLPVAKIWLQFTMVLPL